MKTNNKENIQYITAISTLFSGVLMCFLSFFLTEAHIIDDSVLWYMGQAIIFCSAVFGLDIMIKNKIIDAQNDIMKNVDNRLKPVDDLLKNEEKNT